MHPIAEVAPSDAELVSLAARGDVAAFSELVQRHHTYQALARVARTALRTEMPGDAKQRLRRVIAARLQSGQ